MAHYVVATIKINDRDGYAQYEAGFMEIFGQHAGELLAVSDTPSVLEGDWPFTRAVILRFDDAEAARRWYESPEYQKLAEHRWAASEGSLVSFDGFG